MKRSSRKRRHNGRRHAVRPIGHQVEPDPETVKALSIVPDLPPASPRGAVKHVVKAPDGRQVAHYEDGTSSALPDPSEAVTALLDAIDEADPEGAARSSVQTAKVVRREAVAELAASIPTKGAP